MQRSVFKLLKREEEWQKETELAQAVIVSILSENQRCIKLLLAGHGIDIGFQYKQKKRPRYPHNYNQTNSPTNPLNEEQKTLKHLVLLATKLKQQIRMLALITPSQFLVTKTKNRMTRGLLLLITESDKLGEIVTVKNKSRELEHTQWRQIIPRVFNSCARIWRGINRLIKHMQIG